MPAAELTLSSSIPNFTFWLQSTQGLGVRPLPGIRSRVVKDE